MTSGKPDIAILGGTGDLGSGLAYQLARAGYKITIGSRSADKAHRAAQALLEDAPGTCIEAAANPEAAAGAEVVIMTVPFASHVQTVDSVRDSVQGKIFVDTTVPLVPPKVMRVQLPPGGSAAKAAQLVCTSWRKSVYAGKRRRCEPVPHSRSNRTLLRRYRIGAASYRAGQEERFVEHQAQAR